MRKVLVAAFLFVAFVGPPQPSYAQAPSAAWIKNYEGLRDEAIKNIGWIAGNSSGRPIAATVRPYMTEGGEYYDFFVKLKPPGSRDDTSIALANRSLYRTWVSIGEKAPYDEADMKRRLVRIIAITGEIRAMMKELR